MHAQPPSASLHDATVVLDDRAVLRGATIEVGRGLSLLRGENGAGKTTLLRALAGLVALAHGRRAVSGTPLYIGHRAMLLRGLTPRENLAFLASFRGVESDIAGALHRWGLADVMDRPIDRLSAGQRRRTTLARLEIETPPVVLLDEPFADLDVDAIILLRAALNSAIVRGQCVLMVTHVHHELDDDATARFLLRDGAVVRV